jgi:uncharacterized protein YnzC (UPF0291/DUF896 family)
MVGFAEVIAEAKCTIAFQCYAINSERKCQSKQEQFVNIENLYHGVADVIPYVDRFVAGTDQFSGLFDRVSNGSFELKKVLSRSKTDFSVGKGKGDDITPTKLKSKSASSSELISGAALVRLVDKVLENAKKALAFAQCFLIQGALPSGKSYDDYAQHVLEKMFRDDKKNKGKSRSPDWFFRGFFAFLAWGPLPLDGMVEQQSRLLVLIEGKEAQDKKSRKDMRSEIANLHAVSKKAKAEGVRTGREEASIASSLPSQEERLVQMMSLHLDSNQRSDAIREDYLKSRKEDALQLVKIESDLLKLNPEGDRTDLLDSIAKYKGAVKDWDDFASGLFANKSRVEVDVDFINSYMKKEKSRAIDLTGDDKVEDVFVLEMEDVRSSECPAWEICLLVKT